MCQCGDSNDTIDDDIVDNKYSKKIGLNSNIQFRLFENKIKRKLSMNRY